MKKVADNRVYGQIAEPPRLTRAALWLFLKWIGLPLIASLFLIDLMMWLV